MKKAAKKNPREPELVPGSGSRTELITFPDGKRGVRFCDMEMAAVDRPFKKDAISHIWSGLLVHNRRGEVFFLFREDGERDIIYLTAAQMRAAEKAGRFAPDRIAEEMANEPA